MAKLFSNGDIYISTDIIEIKGDEFSPLRFSKAIVFARDGYSKLFSAIGLIGVGLFLMISFGWTIFGLILMAGGLIPTFEYIKINQGDVETPVFIYFKVSRTSDLASYTIYAKTRDDAFEIKKALEDSFKKATNSLSMEELKHAAREIDG
jgi:hypothetical protein